MRGFAKILRLGSGDVYKSLRVAVHQREPGALHLYHHAIAAAECVKHVGQGELDLRHPPRLEWLGLLEAVAKFPTENVAAHQLLIATHSDAGRIGIRVGKIS